MSLKLLIDEDSQDRLLVKLLREAAHDVITVNEAGLTSQPDKVVFDYAKANNRVLLTYNCDDFEALHEANPTHSGILAIYRGSNRSKNMSFKDIVKAIANIETTEISLNNQFISLNQWIY